MTKTCNRGHVTVSFDSLDDSCPVCEVISQLADAITELNQKEQRIKELEDQLGYESTN